MRAITDPRGNRDFDSRDVVKRCSGKRIWTHARLLRDLSRSTGKSSRPAISEVEEAAKQFGGDFLRTL